MLLLFLILFSLLPANNSTCIVSNENRDIYRQEYIVPEQIESEHFVIHFTVAEDDFQDINGQLYSLQSNYGYAQSIIDWAEYSLDVFVNDGWEYPPLDCDESISDLESPDHCINFGGNSKYDIYISNDGPGMVVPENSYPVPPYTGGMTSYMKISTLSNNYETLPSWSHHVVAHEIHHSIQIRYGTGTSGTPGNYVHNLWFFEQTASYMENVVFPNSNHLYTMLANCNVVTPLTYPNHGVNYPAELYQYRSALWQKYLVESLGDSSIVRYMWEDYGLQFATEQQVSLFPIYQDAISLATDNQFSLSDAFDEYALWRYFTGDRSMQNDFFQESHGYCTSTTHNVGETFPLFSNTGGTYYVELPQGGGNLIISSNDISDISCKHLTVYPNNQFESSDISFENNTNYLNLEPIEDGNQLLIFNTRYNSSISNQIDFTVEAGQNNLLGDLNYDGDINVLDIVIVVNFALFISTPNENEFYLADINQDGIINILDVVQIINIIFNN